MKKIMLIGALALIGSFLASCDFTELPESAASSDMVFSSEGGLQLYTYSFYDALPSNSSAFNQRSTMDYGAKNSLSTKEVGAITVNTSTSWGWTTLRNINYFLENNVDESVDEKVRNHYSGIARLFRARFYYERLVQYGEVPWIDWVFNESDDERLMNPRDSRDVIIRHIIEDLDFAYANITTTGKTNGSSLVNKWTAAGFKSRVCLFEAAWRKYHKDDQLDFARTGCTEYTPEALYKLAADAAKEVMDKGPYKLVTAGSYTGRRSFLP